MRLIIGITILLVVMQSNAQVKENSTGLISTIRTTSDFHTHTPGRQEVIFRLDSGHASGCPWLGIPKENNTFASFLLAAKSGNKPVTVWYYSDLKANSGSSVCQAYTIELK